MTTSENINQCVLNGLVKGVPNGTAPFALDDVGSKGWNLMREDLPLPAAVLRASAIDHNDRWMTAFLKGSGAVIAPHGKTTMSPALFRRQVESGAWAMTVATVQQLQVCREMGLNRVILANQLIGRQAIRYVLDELEAHPDFEFYCLVDSAAGVAMLAEAAASRGLQTPINLLLEGGMVGGRSGCRDLDAALIVARAVKAAGRPLQLVGVEGFEGLYAGALDQAAADGRRFVEFLTAIAKTCVDEDLMAPGPVILSAGGSMFYDLVVEGFSAARVGRETRIVTRSGCYLTHDSGMYERGFEALLQRSPSLAAIGEGLRPALEVWGYVQSRPEATKAICTVGRRDISSDVEMPKALLWFRPGRDEQPRELGPGHVVTGLNDQHAHFALPSDSPLQVGDMVGFGVSHPCTTFDKWQLLYLVDDAYNVTGAVRTFF